MHHCHHGSRNDDMEGYLWMGRRRGGRGFGAFAGGFMGGPGFGDRGFRMGRKLGAADLQLLLLHLLAEKPRHGYELIKALEERSRGYYVPSPGMVYPALTYLEELGYAAVEAEGAKKLYRPTEEGLRHLEENREAIEAILDQLEEIGRKMERIRRAFAEGEAGEEEDGRGGSRELWLARRELRQAIRDKRGSSPEEAKRIAEILRRAAEEIGRK